MNHLSKKPPKQLSLEIDQETHSRIIASSSLNFQIELVEHVGKKDISQLILFIQNKVQNAYGFCLQTEVKKLGF